MHGPCGCGHCILFLILPLSPCYFLQSTSLHCHFLLSASFHLMIHFSLFLFLPLSILNITHSFSILFLSHISIVALPFSLSTMPIIFLLFFLPSPYCHSLMPTVSPSLFLSLFSSCINCHFSTLFLFSPSPTSSLSFFSLSSPSHIWILPSSCDTTALIK